MAKTTTKRRARSGTKQLSTAEILQQIPAARRRERQERRLGLRAAEAVYDAARERVVLELTNGVSFAFPVAIVPGLARASAAQRAELTLSPEGDGILWPQLDTDASVPGLIADAFGPGAVAMALGRLGGQAKSEAKANASRANGSLGGRPRKAEPAILHPVRKRAIPSRPTGRATGR
jgi:hypothetical protein